MKEGKKSKRRSISTDNNYKRRKHHSREKDYIKKREDKNKKDYDSASSKSRSRSRRKEKENNKDLKLNEVKTNKESTISQNENKNITNNNNIQNKLESNNQAIKPINTNIINSRAGGVYVPPFKLAAMYNELRQKNDKNSIDYQKMMWEMLRKSINGIINKVNTSNIQNIIYELFNENLLRGKGLLARAIIKAQMASPNFTHVYAALLAVLNTQVNSIFLILFSYQI